MEIPQNYIKESKLQEVVMVISIAAGLIGYIFTSVKPYDIFITSFMSFASFFFLHTSYLGIKYSVIYLSTGIYSKSETSKKYYFCIIAFLILGVSAAYSVVIN
jgi:hypothetical protein